jgi:hypothetical protein
MIGNAIAGLYGIPVAPSTTAYESIATTTVGSGGTSTVTFSSIPSTYTHLQLRILGRGSTSFSPGLTTYIKANGDSGSNYAYHTLYGNGTSATSTATTSSGGLLLPQSLADSSATANIFGAVVCDLLDYTNTNKNKVIRMIGGFDTNGAGRISFGSALWLSTSAINELAISTDGTLQQYSQIALYGIKG